MSKTQGIKFDQGKPDWSLLPYGPLEEVVRVLEYGRDKYTQTLEDGTIVSGADNWKLVDNSNHRYWNAAMRHMIAFKEGEKIDDESGRMHLAHAICCMLFEIWNEQND